MLGPCRVSTQRCLSALGRRARLVRFEQTDSSTLSAGRAVSAAVSGV